MTGTGAKQTGSFCLFKLACATFIAERTTSFHLEKSLEAAKPHAP